MIEALAGSADPAGAIAAFDSAAALETLATFAGAWGPYTATPTGTAGNIGRW